MTASVPATVNHTKGSSQSAPLSPILEPKTPRKPLRPLQYLTPKTGKPPLPIPTKDYMPAMEEKSLEGSALQTTTDQASAAEAGVYCR